MTQEEADVLAFLWNLRLKIFLFFFCTAISFAAFIMIFIADWYSVKFMSCGISGIYGYFVGPLVKHYFPAVKATTKTSKPRVQSK